MECVRKNESTLSKAKKTATKETSQRVQLFSQTNPETFIIDRIIRMPFHESHRRSADDLFRWDGFRLHRDNHYSFRYS